MRAVRLQLYGSTTVGQPPALDQPVRSLSAKKQQPVQVAACRSLLLSGNFYLLQNVPSGCLPRAPTDRRPLAYNIL